MVPLAPTAKPLLVSINEKSCNVLPCGSGFCQNHCRLDELASTVDSLAANRVPEFPLVTASVSPQVPTTLEVSNAIFRRVFILVLRTKTTPVLNYLARTRPRRRSGSRGRCRSWGRARGRRGSRTRG